jgi:uncharacterized membrane protein YgdD (TMEM256/DUF423 family)
MIFLFIRIIVGLIGALEPAIERVVQSRSLAKRTLASRRTRTHDARRALSPMNTTTATTLAAAVLGGLGVALGAFGAHALKPTLTAHATLATWQTAVLYHLIHAVALLGAAGWRDANGRPLTLLGWIAGCWIGGILCFSGSLYLLALQGPRWLGPVTPLGGLAFVAGWGLVAASVTRKTIA